MLNWKATKIILTVGLIKKTMHKWVNIMSNYATNVMSNYATKADWKNATGVDTSKFAKKVDLGSLKSNLDKLDIDKLKNVPSNLSNLKSKLD